MSFARFFVKSFLFVVATILAVYLAARWNVVPAPPEKWVNAINNAKETTTNLRETASSLEKAAANLEKTANVLAKPVGDSLGLARDIVHKWPALPNSPGGGGGPVPDGVPGSDLLKRGQQAIEDGVQRGVDQGGDIIDKGTKLLKTNPVKPF